MEFGAPKEGEAKAISAEEIEKMQQYKDGKLITLPDGTTRKVYSAEEEAQALRDYREGQN